LKWSLIVCIKLGEIIGNFVNKNYAISSLVGVLHEIKGRTTEKNKSKLTIYLGNKEPTKGERALVFWSHILNQQDKLVSAAESNSIFFPATSSIHGSSYS